MTPKPAIVPIIGLHVARVVLAPIVAASPLDLVLAAFIGYVLWPGLIVSMIYIPISYLLNIQFTFMNLLAYTIILSGVSLLITFLSVAIRK